MKQNFLFTLASLLFCGTVYSQNIGINILSPEAQLDVNGPTLFRGANSNTFSNFMAGGVEFFMGRNANGQQPAGLTESDLVFNWGGAGAGFRHYLVTRHEPGSGVIGNAFDFYTNSSLNANGSTAPNFGSQLQMSITGGGVGIGTNAPGAKLHVAGNQKIDEFFTLEFGAGINGKHFNAGKIGYNFLTGDALDITGAGTDVSNRKIKFWNEGGAEFTGAATINGNLLIAGGNIGIGTNAPGAKLHVAGNQKIDSIYTLEFGAGISGKQSNAGKIGYNFLTSGALDIVGAGTDTSNRKLKFWNEGGAEFKGAVNINGNVSVTGYITSPETVHPLPFLFGWTDCCSGSRPAFYFKDRFGIVHLGGSITSPLLEGYIVVGQLPEGYRPGVFRYFVVMNGNNNTALVRIDQQGYINVSRTQLDFVSLD